MSLRILVPLLILVLAAVAFTAGRHVGRSEVQAVLDAERTAHHLALSVAQAQAAENRERVVTQYVDRIRLVREQGETLIKEVPIYVPSDSCELPGGFRVLHDAATGSVQADPARAADAPPVSAQDVAATVVANYTGCRENAELVESLQDWARGEK